MFLGWLAIGRLCARDGAVAFGHRRTSDSTDARMLFTVALYVLRGGLGLVPHGAIEVRFKRRAHGRRSRRRNPAASKGFVRVVVGEIASPCVASGAGLFARTFSTCLRSNSAFPAVNS